MYRDVVRFIRGRKVPCGLCAGTGRLPSGKAGHNGSGRRCPGCRGRGQLRLRFLA